MNDMTMTEIARLIEGLRSAGWEEKKINDFLLYIESGTCHRSPVKKIITHHSKKSKKWAFMLYFF